VITTHNILTYYLVYHWVFIYCPPPLIHDNDLKLYTPVLTVDDCTKLQHDLNQFQLWCMDHGLNINVGKCSQIKFTRPNKNIISQYYINNNKLDKEATVKDLGTYYFFKIFNI